MSMLAFSCDGYDDVFESLPTATPRKCASCGRIIAVGSDCLRIYRWRNPLTDSEKKKFGDLIALSSRYYCPECGEIFLNLNAIGWCVKLGDMREALRQYWNMTGFDPNKYLPVEGRA